MAVNLVVAWVDGKRIVWLGNLYIINQITIPRMPFVMQNVLVALADLPVA